MAVMKKQQSTENQHAVKKQRQRWCSPPAMAVLPSDVTVTAVAATTYFTPAEIKFISGIVENQLIPEKFDFFYPYKAGNA